MGRAIGDFVREPNLLVTCTVFRAHPERNRRSAVYQRLLRNAKNDFLFAARQLDVLPVFFSGIANYLHMWCIAQQGLNTQGQVLVLMQISFLASTLALQGIHCYVCIYCCMSELDRYAKN